MRGSNPRWDGSSPTPLSWANPQGQAEDAEGGGPPPGGPPYVPAPNSRCQHIRAEDRARVLFPPKREGAAKPSLATIAPQSDTVPGGLQRPQAGIRLKATRSSQPPRALSGRRKRLDGAAPESNRPSVGLPHRTGFEDPLGHRAHAAPPGSLAADRVGRRMRSMSQAGATAMCPSAGQPGDALASRRCHGCIDEFVTGWTLLRDTSSCRIGGCLDERLSVAGRAVALSRHFQPTALLSRREFDQARLRRFQAA